MHRGDGGRTVRETFDVGIAGACPGVTPELAAELKGADLADLDGDGEPELFLYLSMSQLEPIPLASLFFSAKGEHLVPLGDGLGGEVVALEDVDRDGRPDAWVAQHVGTTKFCDTGSDWNVDVRYLAHGLPGGQFSTTDAVAVDVIRARCPRPPTGGRLSGSGDASDGPECARWWGASESSVKARLRKECPKRKDCHTDPCGDVEALFAYAALKPPFVLRP
jgi:hypothetical protein